MKRTFHAAGMARIGAVLVFGIAAACGGTDGSEPGGATTLPPTGGIAGSSAPISQPAIDLPRASAAGGSAPSIPTKPAHSATPGSPAAATGTPYCAVRKVLDSRCTACHNEQKVAGAPMSLKTYADLQAPAVTDKTKKVFQVVGVRVHDTVKPMPPQEKLTADQPNSIDTWVAAGGPEGSDPTCDGTITNTPTGSPTEPTEGATGYPEKCDEVYTIRSPGSGGATSPYMVPAGQEIHPKISIPAPWGNEPVQ